MTALHKSGLGSSPVRPVRRIDENYGFDRRKNRLAAGMIVTLLVVPSSAIKLPLAGQFVVAGLVFC